MGRSIFELNEGDVLEGVITHLTEFAAFVKIGDVSAMLHLTEMRHGRPPQHPSELFEVGQRVRVAVAEDPKKSGSLKLSYRALQPDPWEDALARFSVGTAVQAVVTEKKDYGVFVELAPDVSALLRGYDMAPGQLQTISVGDKIDVVIEKIDLERQTFHVIRPVDGCR